MNTILIDQVSEKLQMPLLAQRNAYSKAKRIYFVEGIIICTAILGTILIPLQIDCRELFKFLSFNGECKEILAIVSVFCAIGLLIVASFLGKKTKEGAILQEYFDVELFKIGWNKTLVGKKPKINEQIAHLTGSEKKISGWYSEKIRNDIPHSLAVLLCYKSNTIFALYLRSRYIGWLYFLLIFYYITYFIFVFIFKSSLYDTAIFLAPSIPFLNLMMNKIKSHKDVLQKYKDIDDQLQLNFDNYKENKILPESHILRSIQDLNYLLRLIPTKVPNIYYYFKRNKANAFTDKCIEVTINDLNIVEG